MRAVARGRKATVLKSSPSPRVNSFDCSLNRHEITVLLSYYMHKSYIHAHNHKSTEDDNFNITIPFLSNNSSMSSSDTSSNLSAISSAQRTECSLVRWTGMTHCASFSGMEQFGSGSRGTVNCFTPSAIFKIFL